MIYKNFIGQILQKPEIIGSTIVTGEDILNPKERRAFEAMQRLTLLGKPIDEMSLAKELDCKISDLFEYTQDHFRPASAWGYSQELIIERSRQNRIKKAATKILNSELPADELLEIFAQATSDVQYRAVNKVQTIGSMMGDAVARFEERAKGGKALGLPTGFSKLDRAFGGFKPRMLYYVGSRPSQGKSTLLMNFMLNANAPSVFFTAESSGEELVDRILVKKGRFDSYQFSRGLLEEKERVRLYEIGGEMMKVDDSFIYYDGEMTMQKIVSISYNLKRAHGIKAIFIDYLQILEAIDKRIPRHEQVAELSLRLKQLAVDLGIPVIVGAQLRRDAEGNKPKNSDFSDSTQIERDADVAIMIYNTEVENEKISFLCITKNRDGEQRDVLVDFQSMYFHFQEEFEDREREIYDKISQSRRGKR